MNTDEHAFERIKKAKNNDITIRDYFAAKAMLGYLGAYKSTEFKCIARNSYALADAMLAERGKRMPSNVK